METSNTIVRGEILGIVPRAGGLIEIKIGGPLPVLPKPNAREVADWLGIQRIETLKRRCKAGKIPHHYSKGRGYHWDWETLLAWDRKDFVPAKA